MMKKVVVSLLALVLMVERKVAHEIRFSYFIDTDNTDI